MEGIRLFKKLSDHSGVRTKVSLVFEDCKPKFGGKIEHITRIFRLRIAVGSSYLLMHRRSSQWIIFFRNLVISSGSYCRSDSSSIGLSLCF